MTNRTGASLKRSFSKLGAKGMYISYMFACVSRSTPGPPSRDTNYSLNNFACSSLVRMPASPGPSGAPVPAYSSHLFVSLIEVDLKSTEGGCWGLVLVLTLPDDFLPFFFFTPLMFFIHSLTLILVP